MSPGIIPQAAGLFAITNVDDIVVLSLFFARGAGHRGSAFRIVAGQYLAFGVILAVAVAVAFGATFLPEKSLPYLGLLPIAIGLWEGREAWRDGKRADGDEQAEPVPGGPGMVKVTTTTLANSGDNIGVYVPVFTNVGVRGTVIYGLVFLALVGALCAAGRFVASRPAIARPLGRWGHILLPAVLVAIGLSILIEGGAFGL
jgi:cadmium resistance protein CadD (predicted permease)